MENDPFLVPFRARMLASAHSVSENGAPDAKRFDFAEGAVDCLPRTPETLSSFRLTED
jgi:hypothetical protein